MRVRRALLTVSGQARAGRLRARAVRARHRDRLHRRHGPRAGGRRHRDPRRSTTTPASRRSSTARSRRSTRGSTPGCWRCGRTRSTCPREEHGGRADRPRVREPLPVRAHGGRGAGSPTEEVVENIDIGGPTLIRAAAEEPRVLGRGRRPESYDAVLEELRMSNGLICEQTREALATEAFAYTARYDAAIARWFAEREDDFPAIYPRVREGARPALRREPAPARGVLRPGRAARTHLLSMVSKLHGKELSFNNLLDLDSRAAAGGRVRDPGRGDRQAQQPVRRGGRRSSVEAYDKALATDPLSAYGGVYCFNRPVDLRAGRAAARDVRRAASSRPATTRTRSRCSRRSRTSASSRTRSAARADRRARHPAGARRAAGPGPRRGHRAARRDARGHRAQADRGGVGRDAVRVEGLQARALERDRAGEGPRDGGDRRRVR